MVGNNTPVFFIRDPSKFPGRTFALTIRFYPHAKAKSKIQSKGSRHVLGLPQFGPRVDSSSDDFVFH